MLATAPGLHGLCLQESLGAIAFQHGQGTDHTCLDAGIRQNCNRARRIRYRPARQGIQNMAVTHAVFQEKSARIPAGCHRAAFQVDELMRMLHIAAFNTNFPTASPPRSFGRYQVATEIDQARAGIDIAQQGGAPVNGIFLADATEIYLHAGGHLQDRRFPQSLVPTDPFQHRSYFGRARDAVAAIEAPHLPEDTGRDVEAVFTKPVKGLPEIEQVGGFLVNFHSTAGRQIDPGNDVSVEVPAELILYSPGLGRNQLRQFERAAPLLCLANQFARAAHRLETTVPGVLCQLQADGTGMVSGARSDNQPAR